MKKRLCTALAILSTTVFASDIETYSVGRYSSYKDIFYSQTAKVEYKLENYLANELGCDYVKLCPTFIKRAEYNELTTTRPDSWFNGLQYDYYKMNLTAMCDEDFEDINFKIYYAMDWEETTEFVVNIKKNGKLVKKEFRVDPEDYPNTSGEIDFNHCN